MPAPDAPPQSGPAAPPTTHSSSVGTGGTGTAPMSAQTVPALTQTQQGGAGEWMAHVKKTMRAHPGMKLKEVLKLAKKTYRKGSKKTARKTRKSRKSKSWFMGGSSTIVAAGYTPGGGPQAGASRKARGRKH